MMSVCIRLNLMLTLALTLTLTTHLNQNLIVHTPERMLTGLMQTRELLRFHVCRNPGK
ncbi:hypothetical protein HanXRQr2_Chr11g0519951 [Helianthus annuus]|uniref:FAS1 domain-containing protein n=1 Tax=Helianthus annuus TaxID=4232 RepID=A0A9K3N2I8_HELAN|nr:hypothetical protein HanXRQr2_Chr11g0519951 [Helianthus annuus]